MWSEWSGGSRRWSAAAAMAATAAVALTAQASAGADSPRATYGDVFTSGVPGASTGRSYAIDYLNPDDPGGKPHPFSHLHLELAEGARFDTTAIPQCNAPDAEIMATGPSACPPETLVGTDVTVVDTGVPGPGRYFTADFSFFNDQDELILVATARDNGARIVIRGKIGRNTLDIENPPLPGTPPEGAAAKSQRGRFRPASSVVAGGQRNYLTTPPTCPRRGYWVNRITYTWRDGQKSTVQSKSPCRRPDEPASDTRPPRIRAEGIPSRCTTEPFRARFRILDASRLRFARVRLDERKVATSGRKRFGVRVPADDLRPGRHALSVTTVDTAGNRSKRKFRFHRCDR